MKDLFSSAVLPFGIFIVIFVLILLIKGKNSDIYDERQIIARGQAYKTAFFSLMLYNTLYACTDAAGAKWCALPVGLLTGIFIAVTVFAVTAILKDAYSGIRRLSRGTIALWIVVILTQLGCFILSARKGGMIEDGRLSLPFVNLFCAVCFGIILCVFTIHEKKTAQEGEDA